ncbi:MAG: ArsR/SmtB family transcription factor [Bacteriovoracia bacterium]
MDKKLEKLKSSQNDVFEGMAYVLASLSAPVRIKLMHFLAQAPLTVEVLSQKIDQSIANTSMHLRKMLNEKVVSVESVGQKRLYSLHPAAFEFWEQCQDFIQKVHPELKLPTEQIYGDINWTHTLEESFKMLEDGKIIFLDVRPRDEATAMTTNKSFLHIPSNELESELSKLSKKKAIVVYCRGRMCALSAFTVNYLRERGYKAFRLKESWFSLSQSLQQKELV